MRYFIFYVVLLVANNQTSAQENAIYDKHLDIYKDVHSILDLEKKLNHKIMTRMYTIRKKKVFQYYMASTGEFVGFSADLDKIDLHDIPHFKSMKGLKKMLKQYNAKEALRRYYALQQLNQEED